MAADTSDRHVDLTGVIDMIVVVTFVGTMTFGVGAAIAGTLIGALGAAIGDRWGHDANLIGGAIGTAIIAGALPGLAIGPRRNIWIALACFLGAALLAYLVADHLPPGREWRMLRWSVSAAAIGIALGGLTDPIRFADDSNSDADDRPFFVLFARGAVHLVRAVSSGRGGAVLAGVISGGVGGLVVGFVLAEAGQEYVVDAAGGYLRVPLTGAGLGALTSGVNGWWTWSRALELSTRTMLDEQPAV